MIFEERSCNFDYQKGFALSQKQKSIKSLHESINREKPLLKILEISTKSTEPLGVALSAFNLKLYNKEHAKNFCLENVFQSSKVFEKGGPYIDLLNVTPKVAKRDVRLQNSGELIHFFYENSIWPTSPKTMFYDWIYIAALNSNQELSRMILEFDIFTDIEFNHKKSINCQARAAAIFVSLKKSCLFESYFSDFDKFKTIYRDMYESEQITLF